MDDKQKKIVIISLVGGGVIAAYIAIKRKGAANQTAAQQETQQFSGLGAGTVVQSAQQNNDAIGKLIADSTNSLGGLITSGLVGLAKGTQAGFVTAGQNLATVGGSLSDKIDASSAANTSGFKGVTDTIKSMADGLSKVIGDFQTVIGKQLSDFQTHADDQFGQIGSKLDKVGTDLTGAITTNFTSRDKYTFYMVGKNSGASCVRADNVSRTCIQSKAEDEIGKLADGNENDIRAAYTSRFAKCWNGSVFDLVCVGQDLAGKGGW